MSVIPPRRRCAIYTRKSSEEGLDQTFNSLDAQRESCEAYVLSQAGEGWECLPTQYNDGGWSGGNMDRPALKQLLADIAQGRIDVVVVYKVDRLTRSLMDFARIVESFDRHNVSFVSVTQAFNTTSSMGRLTLNVLLSFAQFEREVTGERIRDKIAASRAKGMWMGGNLPLGYDLGDRRLEINVAEAETVRHIFTRYAELRSIPQLAHELRRDGILSKRWQSRSGRVYGGVPISCGALSHILNNRIYRGDAVHKGKAHPGEHEAIISDALFSAVQATLDQNRIKHRTRKTRAASSPLTGKIHDSDGLPMRVTFSYGRGKVMYRYYVSECLTVEGKLRQGNGNRAGIRLPAARTETTIIDALAPLNHSRLSADQLLGAVQKLTVLDHRLLVEIDSEALFGGDASPALVLAKAQAMDPLAQMEGATLKVGLQVTMGRKGRLLRSPDATMLKGDQKADLADQVRTAHRRLGEANALPHHSADHINMKGPKTQWIAKRMVIGLLAPDIQKAMLAGTLSERISGQWVLEQAWPLDWEAQRRMIGLVR